MPRPRLGPRLLVVALASMAMPALVPAAVRFSDVTETAGVSYLQRSQPVVSSDPMLVAAQASGGAAAGDYDNDGWVDLIVSRADDSPILFRNRGDGTFVDVTDSAGDLATSVASGSNGVGWADLDNDGDLDLYVTVMEGYRFRLFVNRGDGTFHEEAVARGAALASAVTHYGTSVAFGDYDRDGYLDLFPAEWRPNPFPPEPPLPLPSANRLLRNLGRDAPGFFVDVTDEAQIQVDSIPDVATSPVLGSPGYSPGFVDFDADGCPDLAWVADWGHSRLFWSNCDGTFTDGTLAAGVGRERSGMGATYDDFNRDGWIDWYATSIFGRVDEIRFGVSNQLYLNDGDRTFTNASADSQTFDGGFGWAASGFDFDNDGDLDIATTNGFLAPGHPEEQRWLSDRTRLFRNRGDAVFDEVAEEVGILDTDLGRGLLTFDYDRDGDLDIFIANHASTPILYRNDGGNQGHWLQLELEGTLSNRNGFGSRILVDPDDRQSGDEQSQWLLGNPNFLSQDEPLVHFGLGDLEHVDRITVTWPSGIVQTIEPTDVNQRLQLREPAWAFTEVTEAAGLSFQHGYRDSLVSPDGSFDEARHFAGGVAAGDYDGDGWIDLYAVRGDIGANLLFRNRGDGSFEELGSEAGVAITGQATSGPTFADVDGDGRLDLFVGGVHGATPTFFRNSGNGSFDDVTASSGLAVTRDTFSAAFGDYDGDGDLDLALAHWNEPLSDGQSSQALWRNDGSFRFTDASDESGVSAAIRASNRFQRDFTFTPNFADVDNDGDLDLLLAADIGSSRVLRNRGDGGFDDITDAAISDENGMGAAIGDYDRDGILDWFVSSIWDPGGTTESWGVSGNRLYRGRGDGRFEDATDIAGVREGYWGWAATWGDFDNDGHLDLVHVNGFGRSADYEPSRDFYSDPTRLFHSNGDGTFTERSAELGLTDVGMSRGVVAFDYDRDGDLDLFIAGSSDRARLFRNDGGNRGSHLAVKLRGHWPNSEAIGARISASSGEAVQMRELRAGSNFESQDPAEAHFGFARDRLIDSLEVRWPDGRSTTLESIAADQLLVLSEPPPLSPTATATAILSPTPTPLPSCFGDCDRDGRVTVDELLRGVTIALGALEASACDAMDGDGSASITVDELIAAVVRALSGCGDSLRSSAEARLAKGRWVSVPNPGAGERAWESVRAWR